MARSAAGCEITADRLLDERATLYLIGDAKASKLLRPIFLALLSEIVDRAYERATLAGGRLELPLLLCLDEAGNVAPLPNLAEIASTAPSHNIQLVSIFHDLAQARAATGSRRRQSSTATGRGCCCRASPTWRRCATSPGWSARRRPATRPARPAAGGTSRSTARRRRPLLAPEALRQLPERHALLLYGRLPPARDPPADVVRRPAAEKTGELRHELARARGRTAGTIHMATGGGGPPTARRAGRSTGAACIRASAGCGSSSCGPTCAALRERYRLPVRSGWWEDQVQVEALAALGRVDRSAMTRESGTTRPGKLALLYDLERVAALLRDGNEPFHPDRDRLAFARYLIDIGCQPPPGREAAPE